MEESIDRSANITPNNFRPGWTAAVDPAQSFREIFKCRYSHSMPLLRSFIALVLGYRGMLRKQGDKIYAVSNDFDLAVSAYVKSMSLKHRTGTKPFMGIDLIRSAVLNDTTNRVDQSGN